MKKRVILFLLALPTLHGCGGSIAPPMNAEAAQGDDYDVGDRLPEAEAETSTQRPQTVREVNWDDLMPASWKPMEVFKQLNLSQLRDSDPKAQQALDQLMAEWNSAPVNPAMNGASIRIPGFVVPLERINEKVQEFLLVPYFGACIHVPPPPANQILHVFADDPVETESMAAVWVTGVVETVSSKTSMGNSGYRMRAVKIEPYEEPAMSLPP